MGSARKLFGEGKKVIDAVASQEGFQVQWIHFPQGTDHYLKTGEIISEKTLEETGEIPSPLRGGDRGIRGLSLGWLTRSS